MSRPRFLAGAFIIALLVLVSIAGARHIAATVTDARIDAHIRTQVDHGRIDAAAIQSDLRRQLNNLQTLPRFFAADTKVTDLARLFAAQRAANPHAAPDWAAWRARDDVVALDHYLRLGVAGLPVNVIALVSAEGDIIASSNVDALSLPVGESVADSPFFKDAAAGRPGHQFFVNRNLHTARLGFAHPIIWKGQFIGAALVASNLDAFAFNSKYADAIVTDTNDVVVMASNGKLRMHALPDARIAKVPAEMRLEEYGQFNFPTLSTVPSGMPRYPNLIYLEGSADPQAVIASPIVGDWLNLRVFVTISGLAEEYSNGRWLFAFLAALGIVSTLLGAAVVAAFINSLVHRRDLSRSNDDLLKANILLDGQRAVLEGIAKDVAIGDSLTRLCLLLEKLRPGLLSSVLLLDETGRILRNGAAPSLPPTYNQATDGLPIGPFVGACGTAAYRHEQVPTPDIANDPHWAGYRDIALAHGLKSACATPIFSAEGKVLGTLAFYRGEVWSPTPADLELMGAVASTASVAIQTSQARDALRHSTAQFRQMTDTSGVLIAVVERSGGRILFHSANWPAQIQGDHIGIAFDDAEHLMRRLATHEVIDGIAVTMLSPTGVRRRGLLNARPIEWGDADAAAIAVLDIDDRLRAEEAAAASAKLNESILAATLDSLIVFDTEGRIHQFNQTAERVFGWQARDAVEHDIREFLPGPEGETAHGKSVTDLLGWWRVADPLMGRRRDGSRFPMELAINELGGAGRDTLFICSLRDVTRRRAAEAELLAAKEKAESANRAKSAFLANMSHELRTPMNAILGFSQIISTQMLGPIGNSKYADYAQDINQSGQHLLELICDILDMSKIESGRHQLVDEDVDLTEAIGSALTVIGAQAQKRKLTVERHIDPRIGLLRADATAIRQILINLLSNAVKFTPEGGKVLVAIDLRPDGGLALMVSDTGIGIPEEARHRIFEPFEQADARLARKFEGTGLGLSITRGLVELHGGQIVLASAIDVGTTITVVFPADRVSRQLAENLA